MKGLIYSEPADRWRLVRDRKGMSLVLTHSPTKTDASLANVYPVYEVMRLNALVLAMRLKAMILSHSPTKTVASLACDMNVIRGWMEASLGPAWRLAID